MYIHKDILEDVDGVTLFRTYNFYWSSTEYDNSFAWSQSFSNGPQYGYNKNVTSNSVRAVRAF
jgi:hypothetical protein